MAKKTTDSADAQHLKNLVTLGKAIEKIYGKTSTEAAQYVSIILDENDPGTASYTDNLLLQSKIEKLIAQMASDIEATIVDAVRAGWSLSDDKNAALAKSVLGKSYAKLTQEQLNRYFSNNDGALNAFLQRKESGLNLSERVWRYASQYKTEIELGLENGIRAGQSAAEMSRALRSYLQYPDKLFRRVRNEQGQLVLSKAASAFHPGQGVYRSSYMNARRLAATETNMAYRTADYMRWQQMDFVVGQRVALSNNHNCKGVPVGTYCDICDELAGDYPKAFKFVGWHPHCRCFVTPILKTTDEMAQDSERIMQGQEPTTGSVNQVKTMPKQFETWAMNNQGRILQAQAEGKLPYFVKDNWAAVDNIFNPKPTVLTTLEKAELRHQARSQAEIDDILARWAEHEETLSAIKAANSALGEATAFHDVDQSVLEAVMASGNASIIRAETAALRAEIKATAEELYKIEALVPNAWDLYSGGHTVSALKLAYSSVEQKLAQWANLSLAEQKKKLEFEINYVIQNKKYSTWEASWKAYEAQLSKVNYKIEVAAIDDSLVAAKLYSQQNKKYKKLATLLQQVDADIAAGKPIAEIQKSADAARAEYLKKTMPKAGNMAQTFSEDAYTQARKDAAMWAKRTYLADKKLRKKCGEVWQTATSEMKDAMYGYTASFNNINEPLRGLTYYGSPFKVNEGLQRIPQLTDAIDKSSYNFDMWVQRGDDRVALKKFGLANYDTAGEAELKALVGRTGTEGAFWSCSVTKGKGFNTKEVIFNVYLPRGTKALYAEPFSAYGQGYGAAWDGKKVQNYFGSESEIILQRGTTFRVTKVDIGKGHIYVDLEVIAQKPLPFPYANGFPY